MVLLALSAHGTQKLSLEYEFALLVLLARLVSLVVLPADRLLALAAGDVAHDVAAGRHVALAGLARFDVDDGVKKEGFAMLATEVLVFLLAVVKEAVGWMSLGVKAYATDDVVVIREMRLAVLAAVDLGPGEVGIVG